MKSTIKVMGLLIWLASSVVYGQKITRKPYLQTLTTHSVVVRWRTDIAVSSRVSYSPAGSGNTLTVEDPTPKTEHILTIDGLREDSRYLYRVGTKENDLVTGPDYYFTTAPSDKTGRPVNLWVMGDFGDIRAEKYVKNQTDVRDAYMAHPKTGTDLWFWLGDIGYGAERDKVVQTGVFDFYDTKIFGNIPFASVPGNHEYDEFGMPASQLTRKIHYFEFISPPENGEGGGLASGTKAFYSFNIGNIHIIALDSYGMDNGIYRLYDKAGPQYQWLVKDLEANKSMWTIVALHHPPYTKRSHDSDGETELRLIRESLVPLFDKHKVDLVLTGHSHIYERSWLMKNHTGLSGTFRMNTHAVQTTTGKYDKSAPPFINKDEGTVYVVAGSSGRLDPHGERKNDPAPAFSVYTNLDIGGSLLLTVLENRLDLKWICSDKVVRDQFTMFKNVSKTIRVSGFYGDPLTLQASWPGTHVWSTGPKNSREITIRPEANTVITVRDSLGYLEDRFEIIMAPKPAVVTHVQDNLNACNGQNVEVSFDVSNTDFSRWNYTLELSDSLGSFTHPVVLREKVGKSTDFRVPDHLPEGRNYRVRIRPEADFFDLKPSAPIHISNPAEAKLENDEVIPFDTTIVLQLSFKGSLPVTYRINDFEARQSQSSTTTYKTVPSTETSYRITSVSNVCGIGKTDNKVIKLLPPLGVIQGEQGSFKVFPNPVSDELIIENLSGQPGRYNVLITDMTGRRFTDKTIHLENREVLSLKTLPDGYYLVNLKNRKRNVVFRILKQ